MLSVIMLSVVMLSVVAQILQPALIVHLTSYVHRRTIFAKQLI
jgi:hypothetical protein